MAAQWGQVIKLVLSGGLLFLFRKHYRLGDLKLGHVGIALAAFPVALLCWIGPLYMMSVSGIAAVAGTGRDSVFSHSYYYLRLFNSVFLVAIFEELFVRVYVMGWLHQAELQRNGRSVSSAILDTLDQHPLSLSSLPLSAFSVVGATIVFAAGHQPHEYLSAVLYFLFTTWIYHNTRSLWVCILIHGLSNLAIGLLARHAGMGWLW